MLRPALQRLDGYGFSHIGNATKSGTVLAACKASLSPVAAYRRRLES